MRPNFKLRTLNLKRSDGPQITPITAMTASEIRQAFEALDPDGRARTLASLCEPCLQSIRQYFAHAPNREYRDSVVGLQHVVDVELPVRALSAIRSAVGVPPKPVLDSLITDYQEPMTAHRDAELRFSDVRAEYAYLAVYNLVRSCRDPLDNDLAWLIVRQMLSAMAPEEPTQADVDEILGRWFAAWPTT